MSDNARSASLAQGYREIADPSVSENSPDKGRFARFAGRLGAAFKTVTGGGEQSDTSRQKLKDFAQWDEASLRRRIEASAAEAERERARASAAVERASRYPEPSAETLHDVQSVFRAQQCRTTSSVMTHSRYRAALGVAAASVHPLVKEMSFPGHSGPNDINDANSPAGKAARIALRNTLGRRPIESFKSVSEITGAVIYDMGCQAKAQMKLGEDPSLVNEANGDFHKLGAERQKEVAHSTDLCSYAFDSTRHYAGHGLDANVEVQGRRHHLVTPQQLAQISFEGRLENDGTTKVEQDMSGRLETTLKIRPKEALLAMRSGKMEM